MSKGLTLLKGSRKIHTWVGIALGLFVAFEAVTALYLLNKKYFPGLEAAAVPWEASGYDKSEPSPVRTVVTDPTAPQRKLLGTKYGIVESVAAAEAAPVDRWLPGETAGQDVKSLLFHDGRLFVGLGKGMGLLSCSTDAQSCKLVGAFRDIHGLSVLPGGDLLVAAEKEGAYAFKPASGEKVRLAEAALQKPLYVQPLTWGKLLEDLHTGEIFGGRFMIFWDLLSYALIAYVITGFYIWLKPILIRRSRQKAQPGAAAGAAAAKAG